MYHCIQCQYDFEATSKVVMRAGDSLKKALSTPIICPKCRNFLPVNPDKTNGSKRKDRSNYKGVFKGAYAS